VISSAATLAKYGDFSGYAKLYGKETAEAMRQVWIAQNPRTALHMGIIDEATYKKMTGKKP